MASPKKKWLRRNLAETAEQEAQEAEVHVDPPVPAALSEPVVHPVADVVIAPNNKESTKPRKARPLKSSGRRAKKTTKE